jgi:hypothetical protein
MVGIAICAGGRTYNFPSMNGNGKRRPPRPALDLVAPGAGPEEAAAIAAALEQFLRDTAPVARPALRPGGWERAALREAIGERAPDPWGEGLAWGTML